MTSQPYNIARLECSTSELLKKHENSIRFSSKNKRYLFDLSMQYARDINARIVYSRWRPIEIPADYNPKSSNTEHILKHDVFGYEPSNDCEWYLNFAHTRLFVAYSGSLFAQDEMQVAENPYLPMLLEEITLKSQNIIEVTPLTRTTQGPTPILILNSPRTVSVAVNRNVEEGRPDGLYGNAFGKASLDAIKKATTHLNPPTMINLIAMEAPPSGYGTYSREQIVHIFQTAYTGFFAAREESESGKKCVIHTGLWGCGAYGGNKILMTILQILAARVARIDVIIYHIMPHESTQVYYDALKLLDEDLIPQCSDTSQHGIDLLDMVELIYNYKFKWGESDGN
ncbi:unnamed protein product [Didymodactylos carnosus]|uniref:PARG catalytic Macro domain-containing protein n=1 Tax=Didymodactylos carnosus TaxID=1234261 RepID=A0A815SFW2_9BILA|nr:unnamed protein product [Didymodactylos carnosus]CAF1489612.1 unnamed protein product [Didymodactylos carnosus]CAF3973263.1 unnamed protein product [Didymodactylos carnosus]CAF4352877.1 unnamed protein product [Didymodactylos carnosus]